MPGDRFTLIETLKSMYSLPGPKVSQIETVLFEKTWFKELQGELKDQGYMRPRLFAICDVDHFDTRMS